MASVFARTASTTAPARPHLGGPPGSHQRLTIIAKRYVLTQEVGSGGMGTVFRAYDQVLDEWVALKMLRVSNNTDNLTQLRREVKLARRVYHNNVARVYELGFHASQPFLTLELIDGESFAAALTRRQTFSVERVCQMLHAVASGLQAVHGAGVLHGDVKPANIMRTSEGRIVLTDFGVATPLAEGRSQRTSGTPLYMGPEILRHAPMAPSMDIYALGVTGYRLLTGRRPFIADDLADLLAAKDRGPPRDLQKWVSVPDELAQLLYRCMDPIPSHRPSCPAVIKTIDALALPAPESTDLPVLSHSVLTGPCRPKRLRVAVLSPKGGDAALEPWGVGFGQRLFETLARTQDLEVLGPSVFTHAPLARDSVDWVLVTTMTREEGPASIGLDFELRPADETQTAWRHRVKTHPGQALAVVADVLRGMLTFLQLSPPSVEMPQMAQDAVELFIQAQALHGAMRPDSSREAIQLLNRALVYAPNDPLLTAGLARALVRAWYFSPGEGVRFEEARAAAERAIASAPDRGESYLAAAAVALHAGHPASAARAYRQAMVRAPSLPEAHEGLGRLLMESFHPTEALRKFQTVRQLQPDNVTLRFEELRWAALRRDWVSYEALQHALTPAQRTVYSLSKVRHYLWHDDPKAMMRVARKLDDQLRGHEREVSHKLRMVLDVLHERASPEGLLHFFGKEAQQPGSSRRRRSLTFQMRAELLCYFGDFEAALNDVEEALQHGLCDRAWFELCPLWNSVRDRPRFKGLLALLRDRSRTIYDTLFDGGG